MSEYPKKVIVHYLYLNHKKVDDSKEFKFSNRFNFSLKDNVITVSENKSYVSGFYGEHISNLSVAIGANGAGKTRLCETLINLLQNPKFYSDAYTIAFIYSENDELFSFHSDSIFFSKESLKITKKNLDEDMYGWYKILHPIFLTLVFNYTQFNNHFLNEATRYDIVTSLSTFHVMKNAISNRDKTHDVQKQSNTKIGFDEMFTLFLENEMNEFLRVLEFRELFSNSGIKVPSNLKIKVPFFESTTYKTGEESFSETSKEINQIYWEIIQNKKLDYYQKYKSTFVNRCIYSLINNYRLGIIPNKILDAIVTTQMNQIITSYQQNYMNTNFLTEVDSFYPSDSAGFIVIKEHYLSYYQELDACIDELFKDNLLNEGSKDSDFIFVAYANSEEKIRGLVKALFSKNISLRPISLQLSHQNSSINISAGELNFFTFFSRLLSIDFNDLPPNLFLLIDEADLTFHPQLQKKFLNLILPFLNNVLAKSFAEKYKRQAPHIQVLITTHSPIILSDLISNSIINLEEQQEESKSTFAQNIHELFNNDFILRDGLIGDYAQSKINEIVDYIENNDSYDRTIMARFFKIIRNISEPYIQYKLYELLEEKADPSLKANLSSNENNLIDIQIKKLQDLKSNDTNSSRT
ncbi:MAG: AAA family ATPase [Candidatus Falkowbacteria bacterium]|nr:AAA family ATPase [Candidatus Falkowbacteria bacterium]